VLLIFVTKTTTYKWVAISVYLGCSITSLMILSFRAPTGESQEARRNKTSKTFEKNGDFGED
jgi:hypothetical protein